MGESRGVVMHFSTTAHFSSCYELSLCAILVELVLRACLF